MSDSQRLCGLRSSSDVDATSQKMYKLTGTTTTAATGLGIMVKVMSGDRISILGKSFWTTQNTNEENTNLPLADIVAGMLATPGGAAAAKGVTVSGLTTGANPLSLPANFSTRNPHPGDKKPMAYINYILLDEQFQWAGGNFSRVTTSGQVKDHFTDAFMQNIPVTKNGYLYIYCSNQSPVSVFFDNLQIVHTRGPLIEETHYYPFGLSMAGISSKALSFGEPGNKYKFNDGTELANKEFSDGSGLEWYETFYRTLDPQLGRFWQIDPLAEYTLKLSPYSYASNNPILFNDPLGDTTTNGTDGLPNTLEDVVVTTPAQGNSSTTQYTPAPTVIPSTLQPALSFGGIGFPTSPGIPIMPPITNPGLQGNGDIFFGMDWLAMLSDLGKILSQAISNTFLLRTVSLQAMCVSQRDCAAYGAQKPSFPSIVQVCKIKTECRQPYQGQE